MIFSAVKACCVYIYLYNLVIQNSRKTMIKQCLSISFSSNIHLTKLAQPSMSFHNFYSATHIIHQIKSLSQIFTACCLRHLTSVTTAEVRGKKLSHFRLPDVKTPVGLKLRHDDFGRPNPSKREVFNYFKDFPQICSIPVSAQLWKMPWGNQQNIVLYSIAR